MGGLVAFTLVSTAAPDQEDCPRRGIGPAPNRIVRDAFHLTARREMKDIDAKPETVCPQHLESVHPCLLRILHKLIDMVGGVRTGLEMNAEMGGLPSLPCERRVPQRRGGEPHGIVPESLGGPITA